MTESSWPFDNADTTESQYSTLFRRLQTTGVYGTTETNDLQAFADSSGMQVKLPAGIAFVRGFLYSNDATKTVTVPASSPQNRIDTLVLRLDPTANSIISAIVQGTPGSTSAPALAQTDQGIWEEPLANISVPANATTIITNNVSDQRRFMSHHFGVWETTGRPIGPRRGRPGFNLTLGYSEVWNGTAWVPLGPPNFPAAGLTGTVQNAQLPPRLQDNSFSNAVTDWNTALLTGWYTSAAGAANSPGSGNAWFGQVVRGDTNNLVQLAFQVGGTPSSPSGYTRVRNADGTWSAWYRIGITNPEAAQLANLINGVYAKTDDMTTALAAKISTALNSVAQSNLPFRTQHGQADMVAAGSAPPYTVTKHINFVTGRFPVAPIVLTGINTSADTDSFSGAQNITTTGFDLFFKRDNKVSTTVFWLAYGPNQ